MCGEKFRYAAKFRDPILASSNSSNHNSVSPSKTDIEEQSNATSNSGDPNNCSNHVNNSKDIKKTSSKQYSPKTQEPIKVGAVAASQTEP